jgi:hypothetical protein
MNLNFRKFTKIAAIGAVGIMSIALQGCATSQMDIQIDQAVSRQSDIHQSSDLKAKINAVLTKSSRLSPAQQARLRSIAGEAHQQLESLRTESLRLQAVLVDALFSCQYSDEEVIAIEARIHEVDEQSLSVITHCVESANEVLGRPSYSKLVEMSPLVTGPTSRD